jgi:DNA-directed RNA polymerase specialized sigma24 family protein
MRVAGRYDYSRSPDDSMSRDQPPLVIEQEIIAAELSAALRVAFAQLPARCRRLLSMLLSDPPLSYAEISAIVPIPVGSIGPQRARCLDRLRRSSVLTALADGAIHSDASNARTNDTGGVPSA